MDRIVIKIGTNVITDSSGTPDEKVMKNLVSQICQIKKQKIDVVIISSGAVAFGKKMFAEHILKSHSRTARRQAFASIGQVRLMNTYQKLFGEEGFFCSQVLATREDFRSRKHYLNIRDCIEALIANQIVPILNENDTVAVNEFMFSDNDELAGLTAAMIGADSLIILTSVEGLYDGDPEDQNSKVIHEVGLDFDFEKCISDKTSSLGRGGMSTKCKVAGKLAKIGIETILVNGKQENVLLRTINKETIGTRFVTGQKVSALKKWMAVSRGIEQGVIIVNKGAEAAIINGASVLPVGVIAVEGDFKKDDVVAIRNEEGENFGVGIIKCDSDEAKKLIGKKGEKAMIRRDFLFLK